MLIGALLADLVNAVILVLSVPYSVVYTIVKVISFL